MAFENIQFDVSDGLARLTLNRPKAANALSLDLVKELLEAATTCAEDASIRAVLLSGSGKMFCAGGDLRSFADAGEQVAAHLTELADTLHAAISKLARMNAPLVAAVKAGVYVFTPNGKQVGFIPVLEDMVTNCTFGGADGKTLYITAGHKLWSVRTNTAGFVTWPKWSK